MSKKETLKIEKDCRKAAGDAVHFDYVLLVAEEDGSAFRRPTYHQWNVGATNKQARTRKLRYQV